MEKIKLFIVFLIALTIGLTSCSGLNLGDKIQDAGDEIGDIKDQIGDHLGDNTAILKETLITSVDEVLTKEGFKKCYTNLKDYDFSKVKDWNQEIGSVVDLFDLLHAVRNDEIVVSDFVEHYKAIRKTVFVNDVLIKCSSEIIPVLPIIRNYYDDSVVIKDWGKELDACVASLEVLYENNIRSLDDIISEDSKLDGSMMIVFIDSELIKAVMVKEINKRISNVEIINIEITKADFEQIDTAEKWDLELDAIFDLIDIANDASTMEYSEIVEIYNEIKETILCKKILLDAAPEFAEKLPVVSNYYNESVEIENWENELDAIVASVDELSKSNIENLNDLLNEDSGLNGAMMKTFTQSVILKNALVKELNKALAESNLEADLITVEDITNLSEEAWDAELSAMRNLISLKDNASTLEYTEIVKIYKEVRTTSLCNKVLIASAPTMAETLPVVSTYYDETVVINDWEAELDAIIDTIYALSEANTTAIANPLAKDSPLTGKVLNPATKSIILTKAMVDEMNNAVKASGLAENIITVENIQSVNTVEAWDAELDCMRRLVAIDFANTNMNSVIDIYDDVKQNTILCDTILVSSAEIIIPDLPIICNYYDESLGITDWDQELDSIVSAYKLLVNKGLANITNPIETLDGEVIIACLESKILKAAFVEEFNNNLTTLGLGAYYTMDDAKLAELDTPAKWDNELAAIQAVSDLVNNFSLGKVPAVKDLVESTIIAKAILVAFLLTMGI